MPTDFKRVFRLRRSPRPDAHLAVDDELTHHIDLCVEELIDQGLAPDEARRQALLRFGDLEGTRRFCVDVQTRRQRVENRARVMETLLQDVRYAVRALRRTPGYAALVVLTLAFGIAANTTVVSFMNPYLFRALPYGDAAELVHVTQVNPVTGSDMNRLSLPMFEDWRARATTLDELGAYTYGGANLTGPEGPESLTLSRVTADLFGILRADAALGRTFTLDEGGPAGSDVAVLSHGLWTRRYQADPGVLGRSITIDGVVHTVVGVMAENFVFPFGGVGLWVPVREDPAAAARDRTPYLLVGRMAAGASRMSVADDLLRVQQELAARHPEADGRWRGVTVLPMREALNFGWHILTVAFTVLLGAVVFVLAIACVNVASLTLARASTRTREVAVRTALGAPRARIVRQLLTEGLLLALTAGAVGVALAHAAAAVVGPALPADLYRVGAVSIDGRVLAFSLALTLVTPLLFGLVPALVSTRRDVVAGLKEGSRGSGGRRSAFGRRALVVVQVALAVILITGSGLMLRSFAAVRSVDLGFDADHTLVVTVQPSEAYYGLDQVQTFVDESVERMAAVPWVAAASASLFIPLNHETPSTRFATAELTGDAQAEWPTAIVNYPHANYFETMGIPLLAGRDFQRGDTHDAAPVVIVSQPLAERYWPGRGAVGETLLLGDPADPVEASVVGVVGPVLHTGLDGDRTRPQLYRPATQVRARRHFLLARVEGDPSAAAPAVRRAVQSGDPDLPFTLGTMAALVDENALQWSMGTAFLAVFGAGALLLAALGIYGLIAFSVAQRRRELGVRIALGASKRQVRSAVVGEGLRLTGFGLLLGAAATAGLVPLAASTLFGVGPFDPLTFGGVLVLFLAVAVLASWVPAARACRTDPATVLRAE